MAIPTSNSNNRAWNILSKHLTKAIEQIVDEVDEFGAWGNDTADCMADACMVVLKTQADVNQWRDDNAE